MRAPSHIDFRTAVKMSQQTAIISGVPKLMPLPSYQSQIIDECYSYIPSPEPELRYTPDIEQDGFPCSRGGTPQTPIDTFGFNDPFPFIENLEYLDGQPWSGDGLVPVGLGFEDMQMLMPDDSWTTPEPGQVAQANMFAQNPEMQDSFDTSLDTLSADWSVFRMPTQDDSVPPSKDVNTGLDSGIVMQGEWTQPPPPRQDTFVDMGNLITSAPYVPKMQVIPGHAPVWEDVFMPSSTSYGYGASEHYPRL
ncbi:uncharacterized protein M421DRAFT_9803 [Didymella exigua CBS 183.55]|uniref:Uncharacterized protein n=1 Tax=Didymella exigua CBS 183.55 TaxID=1150837 RepID=A0A6A5R6S4_9PLEO|nr:uncharacterized protein M421DRAFT_9803 [Didymella exigua CBS 183.55]KAF1923293.1 hypothetical protein M421DRAFT_9803 [Didymella exigua CBS 183.55]